MVRYIAKSIYRKRWSNERHAWEVWFEERLVRTDETLRTLTLRYPRRLGEADCPINEPRARIPLSANFILLRTHDSMCL
jgi:hypothetical protein